MMCPAKSWWLRWTRSFTKPRLPVSTNVASFRATVRGHVQGVNFRHFVYTKAVSLRLTGQVRNLSNGGVEVFAEGSREDLDGLLEHLNQGPRSAHVTTLDVEWGEARGELETFEVTG